MSDASLHELEKQFRDSNALEDEVMWLTRRLNEGEVSAEDLEVTALCGHEASRVILAEAFEPVAEFWAFVESLVDYSFEAASRVVIAAAEVGLAQYEQAKPSEQLPRSLMLETAMKVQEPGRYLSIASIISVEEVVKITSNVKPYYGVLSVRLAAMAVFLGDGRLKNDILNSVTPCLSNAVGSASYEEVRTAICVQLIPWVLGYYDPLVDLIARLQK